MARLANQPPESDPLKGCLVQTGRNEGAVCANLYEVFLRALDGADRVVIETRNALGEMDAHYLHAPTLRDAIIDKERRDDGR